MTQALLDFAETTLSSNVDAVTTTFPLSNAAKFPDPASVGPYWVWIWNAATNPNPKDASDAERIRATSKSGSNLIGVRGEDGQTAKTHGSGDVVAILVDQANLSLLLGVSIVPFGGDLAGTGDASAEFQKQMDAAILAKRPMHLPGGRIRLDNKVTPTDTSDSLYLRILGEGSTNTTIIDNVSGDPCLEFGGSSGATIHRFLQLQMERLGFELNVDKPTKDSVGVHTRTSNHTFIDIRYDGKAGSGRRIRRAFDFTDCWNITFRDPNFNQVSGIAIHQDNTLIGNGGNLRIFGGEMVFGRTGVFVRGTKVNNNILLSGTKFAFNQDADWVALDATTLNGASNKWTQGATVLKFPSGLSNFAPNAHAFVISGGDQQTEVHTVASYDDVADTVTILDGLEQDWSGKAGADIFIGSFAVVTGNLTKALTMVNPHFEFASVVLCDAEGTSIVGGTWNSQQAVALAKGVQVSAGNANTYGLYMAGRACFSTTLYEPTYTTDRADHRLGYAVNSPDTSNNVGPIFVVQATRHLAGGGGASEDDVIGKASSGTKIIHVSSGKIQVQGTVRPETLTMDGSIRRKHRSLNDADTTILLTDDIVQLNSQTDARTFTLPNPSPDTPPAGMQLTIIKSQATSTLTIDRNGLLINGSASNPTALTAAQSTAHLIWVGGNTGWKYWVV